MALHKWAPPDQALERSKELDKHGNGKLGVGSATFFKLRLRRSCQVGQAVDGLDALSDRHSLVDGGGRERLMPINSDHQRVDTRIPVMRCRTSVGASIFLRCSLSLSSHPNVEGMVRFWRPAPPDNKVGDCPDRCEEVATEPCPQQWQVVRTPTRQFEPTRAGAEFVVVDHPDANIRRGVRTPPAGRVGNHPYVKCNGSPSSWAPTAGRLSRNAG